MDVGMFAILVNIPPGNIYYIVKYRGEGLVYSKYSEGKVCYAEGLLYDTGS